MSSDKEEEKKKIQNPEVDNANTGEIETPKLPKRPYCDTKPGIINK